ASRRAASRRRRRMTTRGKGANGGIVRVMVCRGRAECERRQPFPERAGFPPPAAVDSTSSGFSVHLGGITMLRLLGSERRSGDAVTRRELLAAGAMGALTLPHLLAAEQKPARKQKAKHVILLYLLGGAATQDWYDLKPSAPSGVRSEFKPIQTSVTGVQVCEH